MQCYFVPAAQPGEGIILPPDISHHLVDVMRAAVGDQVELVVANHQLYLAEVTNLQPTTVKTVRHLVDHSGLPVKVTIACGVPKTKDKSKRGTELGADRIVFFDCQRAVSHWSPARRAKKLARLQKIANGATEQSHRVVQPLVDYRDSWADVFRDFASDVAVVAWEESAKQGEISRLRQTLGTLQSGQRLLAFFGPEGGLTSGEVEKMTTKGVQPVGLGPRILRTETAPLYFLSAVSYQTELNG